MPKQWLTVISGGNPGLNNGFPLFQTETRASKQWLAITSDSNPLFKMRKTRRQKDGCSSQRVSLYGLLYIHTPSG